MTWITIAAWPGGKLEVFDELSADHHDDDHGGLLARFCSQQPDALRVVGIWDSQDAADRFFAQLPEANRARLAPGGEPTITAFAADRAYLATELPAALA